jgi:uncharacterized protein (UPF0332 family)
MPISPRELRDCAKELAGVGCSEAKLRASISRAYYAAYHALLPFVERLPCSRTGDATAAHVGHREMFRRIQEWRVSSVCSKLNTWSRSKSQLAHALSSARKMRELADYRLVEPLSANEAEVQLERVRKILQLVSQIDAEMKAEAPKAAPTSGTPS